MWIDFFESCSENSEEFSRHRLDTTENQDSKSYASIILSGSDFTFLSEEEDQTFRLFLSYVALSKQYVINFFFFVFDTVLSSLSYLDVLLANNIFL